MTFGFLVGSKKFCFITDLSAVKFVPRQRIGDCFPMHKSQIKTLCSVINSPKILLLEVWLHLCGGEVLVIRLHLLGDSAKGYLLLNLREGQEEVLEDKDQ